MSGQLGQAYDEEYSDEDNVKTMRRLLFLAILLAAPSCAQTERLDERLPDTTNFYLYWRGAASLEGVRGTNALLRLWADPDFVPFRNALLNQLVRERKLDAGAAAKLTPEMILSLLENPLLVGNIRLPEPPEVKVETPGAVKPSPPNGFFVIYAAKGKRELHDLINRLSESDEKEPPKVTKSKFRQTTIEAVVGEKKTNYRAFVGDIFLETSDRKVLEALIPRFDSEAPPAEALRQTTEYQEARKVTSEPASVELFVRLSELLPSVTTKSGSKQDAAAMTALGVHKLRSIAAGLSFARDTTHFRGAILGDMSPGSIFDIFGESVMSFPTASAAPADTANFNVLHVDLPAVHRLVLKFANAMVPAGQNPTAAFDAVATQAFGMSVAELLNLFTGEIAWFSPNVGLDLLGNVYVVGIRNHEDVLHVLRVALEKEIQSEDQEGAVTYLSITSPFTDSKSGATRRRFQYIGVTPDLLWVAPRKAMLKELVAQRSKPGGAAPAGLAGDAKFNAARARMPQGLSGFGYADFSRINWDDLVKEVETQLKEGPKNSAATSNSALDWKSLLKSAVFSRHLHLFINGWWKDRDGLHFDGFIE
jgi:hypothetical protein